MAQKENRRKVRAVLAGGLVLGVGAVLTLAAWNSSEFATGTFQTGAFVLEGKTPDEVDFSEHPDGGAAQLDFSMGMDSIAADEIVSASFQIRLSESTSEDATINELKTTVFTSDKRGDPILGPVGDLSYEIYTTSPMGCDNVEVNGTLFASGVFDGAAATVDPLELVHDPLKGVAGPAKDLCFLVSAGENLQQGVKTTIKWELIADQNQ